MELYSKFWAIVNIPDNIDLKIPNEEKIWLKRLSRLPDLFYAKVSTMVVLAEKDICSEDKIEFYNILEKFIFIFKLMAQDKNDMSFLIAATRNLLWCDKNEKNKKIKALINSIKQHDILPLNKNCIMQAIERFHEYIMNKNYYNWNGLKYFLFEYNNSLQMKKNPSNISYLNSKYTYVIEKDYENNLKFFKCGTEINGKAYRIQYNFIDNKLWINTWNDDGEYYFENSDNFPDILKRFIKSFFRYIRKTTENDIPKFYT